MDGTERDMDEKRFVTLEQLVGIFPFLKKSRVYYLTTTKGIPFYRVGRSLVFELGEIRQWIEAGRVPSNGGAQAFGAAR
jgi:hypothetical protein